MKYCILFLSIAISSCSTNSTSPPQAETTNPFPRAFSTVVVSLKALPNHWYSEQYSWNNGNTTSTQDTGTSNFSGTMTFSLDSNSFKWNGDTVTSSAISGNYPSRKEWDLSAVVDKTSGIIDSLMLSYSYQSGGSSMTGYDDESDEIVFHRIPYRSDSLYQAVIQLSGNTLSSGLISWLESSSSESAEHASAGSGSSLDRNWNGSITDTSSINIHFNR